MWTCIACGHSESGPREPAPCACGVEGSWTLLAGTRSAVRAVRADAVQLETRERVSSGTPELDRVLGGGWVLGSMASVVADAGAGKSRLCYRWASAVPPTLLVGTEMALELMRETAESAGAELGELYLLMGADGWRAEAERLGVRSVVLDSVSETPLPGALVAELYRWATEPGMRRLVFAISHQNRRRRARSDPRIEYIPDYNLSIRPRGKSSAKVLVRKSRYCARGSAVVSLVGGSAIGGSATGEVSQNA